MDEKSSLAAFGSTGSAVQTAPGGLTPRLLAILNAQPLSDLKRLKVRKYEPRRDAPIETTV